MHVLTVDEIDQVSGAFVPAGAATGALVGVGLYAFDHRKHLEQMTVRGIVWALGTGATMGAMGRALKLASGGGWAASAAWEPGLKSLGFGLGQVSKGNGW
jgi:hypothetical protein